jgi:tRNA1Val (adenine37-N6)-methyltransferase
MPNNYFNFKQFRISQQASAFKVGTDGVLLGAYAGIDGAETILDIGSGTGLISLMIAQRSNANITALEPDYDSYLQTCENVSLSPWSDRISVRNSSLQDFDNDGHKFDLIVTNPPYFQNSLKNPDSRKSSARHNDTLTTGALLTGVMKLMKDDGHLQMILPYVEGNIFIAEAAGAGLYCNSILKIKPLPSAEVRRLIMRFSKIHMKPAENFLTIGHGKRHEFTQDYINLTKDFYLKF